MPSKSDRLIETEVKKPTNEKPDFVEQKLICEMTVGWVFGIIVAVFVLPGISYTVVFIANDLWKGCEQSSLKNLTPREFLNITLFPLFYPAIFCVLIICLGGRDEKPSRIWPLIMIVQAFLVAYLVYNPHVPWFPERAEACMNYSFTTTRFILVPLFLLNSLFCAFAFYKLDKLRIPRWYEGDDSYEVIYGGEESSTKVIEVNSNV